MKNVLLIAAYCFLEGEIGFNRYYYIAEQLSKRGCNVTLITSEFRHYDKTHREKEYIKISTTFEVILLKENGYEKNVGIQRIISHKQFASNLKKYLLCSEHNFDVIYVGIPIPEAGKVAGEYAKAKDIPFIIDVMDIWPEAMRTAIDYPVISDLLFFPLKRRINKVYSLANVIFGVSQTYVDRAVSVNKKAEYSEAIFIGTELKHFDELASNLKNDTMLKKEENDFWVTYIGTLGHSYDIKTLIKSISLLYDDNKLYNVKLLILGDGPLRTEFEIYAKELRIEVVFTGFLEYPLMIAYLKKSDIAINSIKKNAAQSIVTKVGDYMAAGLPILNGGNNIEFRNMVEEYKIGINYDSENPVSLKNAIYEIYNSKELRGEMARNSRLLAEEKFDRGKTYLSIYDEIMKI